MDEKAPKITWKSWILAGVFLSVVSGAAAVAVVTLHARASTSAIGPARPALTVSTKPIRMTDHYFEEESFVGRVEPARQVDLAAERPGLLVAVLVDEGDLVREGQALARLDVRPLKITRNRLLAERTSIDADIELAKRTTDRRARLVGEGWSSGQTYDEARFSVTSLTARRKAVDAQIAQVELDLQKSVIAAPFAGRIAARLADEGTVIGAGTPLLHLQEVGKPQARIGVPSDRAVTLAKRDRVSLDYQGHEVIGQIASVTPDLEVTTRTVPVLIDIETDGALAMGQVIRLKLMRRIEARGTWVDIAALQEAERGLWSLMTVDGDKGETIATREAVEILHIQDDRAYVRGTFSISTHVIDRGGHRLSVGQVVIPLREQ